MRSHQRKVLRQKALNAAPKVALALLIAGVLAVAVILIHSVTDLPVVFKAVPGKVVGCAGPDTGWKQVGAENPTCQRILKGQYEVEWVPPAG